MIHGWTVSVASRFVKAMVERFAGSLMTYGLVLKSNSEEVLVAKAFVPLVEA